MIIISESSAEATRPVRTDRCTPARGRSSAAQNNSPKHTDARSISVQTKVLAGGLRPFTFPGDRSASRHCRDGASDTLNDLLKSTQGLADVRNREGAGRAHQPPAVPDSGQKQR
jgi:hypothetical protein